MFCPQSYKPCWIVGHQTDPCGTFGVAAVLKEDLF